jgi:hypothetical protein
MTIAQDSQLRLQLDEVDMIAYANDSDPICSFYYDDGLDSNATIERARDFVHRVNVHDQVIDALDYFFNIMHDYEDSVRKGYVKHAMDLARAALAAGKGSPV